jgi:hypothetical protein
MNKKCHACNTNIVSNFVIDSTGRTVCTGKCFVSNYCNLSPPYTVLSGQKPKKNNNRKGISYRTRYKLLIKNNFKCSACGVNASEQKLEIDHITPVSKGGSSHTSNLQVLCLLCNQGKGDLV